MNDLAILRKKQVEELTGRSYSSLRRDMAAGQFPRPIQLGPRSIGWKMEDVRAWVNGRPIAALPAAIAKASGNDASRG